MNNIYDLLELLLLSLGVIALVQFIYMNHVSIFDYWFGEDDHE